MKNQAPGHVDKNKIRARIFEIIQIGNTQDMPSRMCDIFLVAVIVVNILVMILETFEQFRPYSGILNFLEVVTLAIFCLEYAFRIWTADFLYPDLPMRKAVVKFLFSFDGIVELLTILPFFYLSGFVAFRMMRVVRIFHLFRINKTYDSFNVIQTVIFEKRTQLASSVFIIMVLMLAASITMYNVEHAAQPEHFKNALSGIWWAVSAVLTIGYGDIYPITLTGKILAVIISCLGVGAVALPTGIISAGFVEQYTKMTSNSESSPEGLLVHTVVIDVDSAWIGETAAGLAAHYGMAIVFVKRARRTFVPDAEYNIQVGDALAVCAIPVEV